MFDFLIFGLSFPLRKNHKTKNARKKVNLIVKKEGLSLLETNSVRETTLFFQFFYLNKVWFLLSVAHWGHEAKHKLLKKMLYIGDNVAHWGVAHWVHPMYYKMGVFDTDFYQKFQIIFSFPDNKEKNWILVNSYVISKKYYIIISVHSVN